MLSIQTATRSIFMSIRFPERRTDMTRAAADKMTLKDTAS